MNDNIDYILVEKILKSIPEKINPVDYLMEVLNLSRDSVYRRINCKKSFTYREIVKLSSILNFSLDEMLHIQNNSFTKEYIKSSDTNIETSIYLMLRHFRILADNYVRAKDNKEIVMSANRLPDTFIVGYDILFRFICYRWMHLMREFPLDYPFQEFKLHNNIVSACNDLLQSGKGINYNTFIFDENLYLNTIKDIQYFYKRRLISDSELRLMKDSFIALIDMGKDEMLYHYLDKSSSFYLSTLNIPSSTIYFRYDDKEETDIWSFLPNPIYLNNKVTCATHRKWLYSLRRYAALVSGANENILYDFFEKQYGYVENMDNVSYIEL